MLVGTHYGFIILGDDVAHLRHLGVATHCYPLRVDDPFATSMLNASAPTSVVAMRSRGSAFFLHFVL